MIFIITSLNKWSILLIFFHAQSAQGDYFFGLHTYTDCSKIFSTMLKFLYKVLSLFYMFSSDQKFLFSFHNLRLAVYSICFTTFLKNLQQNFLISSVKFFLIVSDNSAIQVLRFHTMFLNFQISQFFNQYSSFFLYFLCPFTLFCPRFSFSFAEIHLDLHLKDISDRGSVKFLFLFLQIYDIV